MDWIIIIGKILTIAMLMSALFMLIKEKSFDFYDRMLLVLFPLFFMLSMTMYGFEVVAIVFPIFPGLGMTCHFLSYYSKKKKSPLVS
mgnify:FL=1